MKKDNTENGPIDAAFAKIRCDFNADQACEDEVCQLLDSLEILAQSDCDMACSLMIDLWPIASSHFQHDICDRIDLWIAQCRSPEIIARLRDLAASHPDGGIRKHWQGLLSIE